MTEEEKYENLINSSLLFSIDKEEEPSLWDVESKKLTSLICEFYYDVEWKGKEGEEKKGKYGLELVISIKNAVEGYKKENGEFLHYFRKIFSYEKIKAKRQEDINNLRQGIHVPRSQDKLISSIIKFAKANNCDLKSDETILKISKVINVEVKEVKDAIECYLKSQVVHSTVVTEEGDEIELYNLAASDKYNVSDDIEKEEALKERIKDIDKIFNTLKGETKEIISLLLTSKLLNQNLMEKELGIIKKADFFNSEVFADYIKKKNLPTQRDIASKFNSVEASVSRTYKQFIEKIKDINKRIK